MRRPHAPVVIAATALVALVGAGVGPAGAAAPAPTPSGTSAPVSDRHDLDEVELPAPSDDDYSTDHVLVRFADRTSPSDRRSAIQSAGASGPSVITGTGFLAVEVEGVDPSTVVAQLEADPAVADVQLDPIRRASGPAYPVRNYDYEPYLDLMRLRRAWDETRGAGATIAILDTGVTANSEFDGRLLPGTDLVDGDTDVIDSAGHGTVVAGVAAAADDFRGSVGAAPGASVLPVRILDTDGEAPDSRVVAGIAWAVAHGADVINLSLGGPAPSPMLRDAIAAAVSAGVVVVAAAGDEGTDAPQYPAAYAPEIDGLLSVSATDDFGALTDFSSWGDSVSLAAPGFMIVGPRGYYTWEAGSGTSFAAPSVSGVAALVAAQDPRLTPAQIEDRLTTTARDSGPKGLDPYYGAGIVDAASAITAALPSRAAVAVAIDRAPADPGPDDDTSSNAQPLPVDGAEATLSPEGDVDWYTFTAPDRGWYRFTAEVEEADHSSYVATSLAPLIEVRDADGNVLPTYVPPAYPPAARVVVAAQHAGDELVVGVSNANGSAAVEHYELRATSDPGELFDSTTTSVTPNPGAMAVGDVDGDEVPDAVTIADAGYIRDVPVLLVLRGLGDGHLAPPEQLAVPGGVARKGNVQLADLDGDDDADLLVPSTAGYEVFLQSDGRLVHTLTIPTQGAGTIGRAHDVDGDADIDLVLDDPGAARMLVMLNDGTGTFAAGPPVPRTMSNFAVGDVTSDGLADVVGDTELIVQQPGGTWAEPSALSLPLNEGPLAIGDVTGDGLSDLVRSSHFEVVVEPQLVGGGFGSPQMYRYSNNDLVIADVDADGREDVVARNDGVSRLGVLFQQADGSLGAPVESGWSGWPNYGTDRMQIADLDRDGDLDVTVPGWNSIATLRQNRLDAPARSTAWVSGMTPAPHTAGVDARPTIQIALDHDLDPASMTPATVRLIDAVSTLDVPATRVYDAATRTVSVVPSAPLTAGSHYAVTLSGVRDTSGATMTGSARTWFTVAAGADRYTPIDPVRVLDTRYGTGLEWAGPAESGEQIELDLSYLPADTTAVVLNVTAASPSSFGNVRVFPSGTGTIPRVSNLNVAPGVDQANLVTVAVGPELSVTLLAEATSTDLIADLAGYYSPGGATAFEPVAPVRVMDTRDGTGARRGTLRGGQWVDLQLTGTHGVPADAAAVVLNVTGTQVTGATHVRVYPAPGAGEDQTPPDVSNLNLAPGRDQPNLVTVRVGDGGRIRFFTPVASTFLIADLAGYYTPTADHGFVAIPPTRLADTRVGLGIRTTLTKATASTLAVGGTAGVPADAVAAVLNVTGVHPRGITHVRTFPTTVPATVPDISTINLVPGRDEANLAVVKLGTGGKVGFFPATADVDLVVDVGGYFRR